MKLVLLLFVATFGAGLGSPELTSDLMEFVDLVPLDEVNVITDRYLQDPDFVNVVLYVLYGDYKYELLKIEGTPEFLKLIKYLEESGLEVYEYLDLLHQAVGLPPIIRPLSLKNNPERGRNIVDQCRDEVRAILPQDQINALHQKKLDESISFSYFAWRLETEEIGIIVQNLYDSPIIQESYNTCMENGLDIVDNFVFYLELFGFRDIAVIQKLESLFKKH